MTNSNNYVTLNMTSGMRIFYVNNGLLVGAGSLTASLMSTERSPFLLESKMRDKLGRFVKGYRSSPKTEFKKGHLFQNQKGPTVSGRSQTKGLQAAIDHGDKNQLL